MFTLILGRLYPSQKPKLVDLSGKISIVTGANSGIGLSIATALAKQGATVYLACRNPAKFQDAIDHIVQHAGENCKERVICWKLDVGDLRSVREFCERWAMEVGDRDGRKLDILVHNAGIASYPTRTAESNTEVMEARGEGSKEERDIMYMTNFLGSFLMTHLLEAHLSPTARVILTSSTGHYAARLKAPSTSTDKKVQIHENKWTTKGMGTYAITKAYQVVFASLLQRHFSSSTFPQRSVHAFTPGFTSTPIFSKYTSAGLWKDWLRSPLFMMLKVTESWIAVDVDEGAKTGWWLASTEEKIEDGAYWEWMRKRVSLADVTKEEVKRGLWAMWERDAGLVWRTDEY